MLASLAGMAQQFLTLLSMLSAVIFVYPWLLLLLIVATIPVFLGETRFAILNYSMLYRYTPERRELDYLRYLGASSESAKEIKIFGLGNYLADRSRALLRTVLLRQQETRDSSAPSMARLLNLAPTGAYYIAYALILRRALDVVALSMGDLTLATGAFSRARSIMERFVSGLAGIAEQSLFIKGLIRFFRFQADDRFKARRPARTPPHQNWVRI